MTHALKILLLAILLTSCGGSGVTVTKSQTVEYLSKAFSKSKAWFKSTDGEAVGRDGPPPPSHLQPTARQALDHRINQSSAKRMSKKDYARAIKRLESSIPDLEKELGENNIEVGETYYTIGSMYLIQKNPKAAKSAYTKSLKIFSNWLGAEHPRVWQVKDKINRIN